jgi:hypothetical protein
LSAFDQYEIKDVSPPIPPEDGNGLSLMVATSFTVVALLLAVGLGWVFRKRLLSILPNRRKQSLEVRIKTVLRQFDDPKQVVLLKECWALLLELLVIRNWIPSSANETESVRSALAGRYGLDPQFKSDLLALVQSFEESQYGAAVEVDDSELKTRFKKILETSREA